MDQIQGREYAMMGIAKTSAWRTLVTAALILAGNMAAGAEPDKQESLLAAERAYSARSAAIGFVEATAEVLAEEAVTLIDNSAPIVGKAAMLAATRKGWPPPEARPLMTWEPSGASVSEDGTMGFTYGIYTLRSVAKDGATRTSQGTFTTVWKREAGGQWHVLMDTGHNGLAP